MELTFLGAAQEVTGSMHLLSTERGSILIDCGFFQGKRNESRERNRDLPKEARDADAVILTHAHIDHSGSLPTLVRSGFTGSIYTTPATRDLAVYMLRDSARIQRSDAEYVNRKFQHDPHFTPIEPIYDEGDAIEALEHFVSVSYRRAFSPIPGVRATFLDAGHILGSAQVLFEVDTPAGVKRMLFSGDLGRHNLPILRDPETPPCPLDYLCVESTYGDRLHGSIVQMHDELERVIKQTISRRGKIIIPAFALGRTQEILYVLHELRAAKRIPEIPVFVDSPLAVNVTTVFRTHPECFDAETRLFIEKNGDVFSWPGVSFVTSREESMRINAISEPVIIISASGMAESGRILHHLRQAVGEEKNTILTVGFMAQHTLGRRIIERRPKVRIFGIEHELRAQVEVMTGFSAHADQKDLLTYVGRCKNGLGKVFLVHGEPEAQVSLAGHISSGLGIEVARPARGEHALLG